VKRLNADEQPDALGSVLADVRFRSTIFCRSEMTAPWGFSISGRDIATFHFVEQGSCCLEVSDVKAMTRLHAGDLVILPHGHAHVMRDAPASSVRRLDDLLAEQPADDGMFTFGGGGPATRLICGGFIFDDREALPFLPALPPVLHLSERSGRVGSLFRVAQEIIAGELSSSQPAGNSMLSRVSDLLFIEAVRTHFSDATGGARGWFAALKDRHIGKAISAIHREPHRPWTVASLASEVGLSRTAFALRFSLLLGESPIRYVAGRRIAHAGALLTRDNLSVAKVSELVGYESEVAFSRAFKRHVGLSPVEYRRARRTRHQARDAG
jgi:AraC family transcriptional regulator, alkane utilization regulator